MGSRGRRTAAYRRTRQALLGLPCWLQLPGCTGVGETADHDPPLSTAPTPETWQGTLKPACWHCQRRQGQQLANQTNRRSPIW